MTELPTWLSRRGPAGDLGKARIGQIGTGSMDLAAAFEVVKRHVNAAPDVAAGMHAVLDELQRMHPEGDWSPYERLPYDRTARMLDWCVRPFRRDPPSRKILGLWFGIFNPVGRDGQAVADLYVCGSAQFDADPEDNSWAVGPEWWPDGRESESAVLREIYRLAYQSGGLKNNAEYPLCLAYSALVVKYCLQSHADELSDYFDGPVGVACGFDSGDFLLVGSLDAGQLT